MKKIFSILLVISMFMAINSTILPTVQAADNQQNNSVSAAANIVPAKGLDEEDLPKNTPATEAIPKTGLENITIIAIIVVSMIGLGSFIRAKTIKIN